MLADVCVVCKYLDAGQSLTGVSSLPFLASSAGRAPCPGPVLGGHVCLLEATVFSRSVAGIHSRYCGGRWEGREEKRGRRGGKIREERRGGKRRGEEGMEEKRGRRTRGGEEGDKGRRRGGEGRRGGGMRGEEGEERVQYMMLYLTGSMYIV